MLDLVVRFENESVLCVLHLLLPEVDFAGLLPGLTAGRFDGIFFADTMATADSYAWETIEAGAPPRPDPWTLLPLIALMFLLGVAPHLLTRLFNPLVTAWAGHLTPP